jgi:putative membrane protein insertion efficiency factor
MSIRVGGRDAELSTGHRVLRPLARGARLALRVVGWPARTVLLTLIRCYRATLSGVLGGQCRFEPSCSTYAADAIRSRGAVVGPGLALWRIVRCNPFARGGSDPAPRSAEYETVIQEHAA